MTRLNATLPASAISIPRAAFFARQNVANGRRVQWRAAVNDPVRGKIVGPGTCAGNETHEKQATSH
jgi:hypothetical protein